jgi:hypothetical protein
MSVQNAHDPLQSPKRNYIGGSREDILRLIHTVLTIYGNINLSCIKGIFEPEHETKTKSIYMTTNDEGTLIFIK